MTQNMKTSRKNHSLIMNRAIMEAKVLMHKTRKDLALFDELHYKNPETAGCLELIAKIFVPQLREVCSD